MGGFTQKQINVVGTLLSGFIYCLFLIYQFIQLSFDRQYFFIYGITSFWAASKFIVLCIFIKQNGLKDSGILFYILSLIFQSEWISIAESKADTIKYLIAQTLINVLPITFCNIYLISDVSRNITHGYYIAMIFINHCFIVMVIYASVGQLNKYFLGDSALFMPFSISIHFCFCYLLMQGFIYNWIIPVSLIGFNSLMCILAIILCKGEIKISDVGDQIDLKFYKVISYIFQINCYKFQSYSSNYCSEKLKPWKQIFQLGVQCLNVIVLTIFKFHSFRLIIKTDQAFFVFLGISLIQLYIFSLNFFYKLTKQNNYILETEWKEGQLSLEQKAYRMLSDKFAFNYLLNINLNPSCLQIEHLKTFEISLTSLKQFIKQAINISKHKVIIQIQDVQKKEFSIQLVIHNSYIGTKKQEIELKENFYNNQTNKDLVKYIFQIILQERKNQFKINSSQVDQTNKFLIELQTFSKLNYQFIGENIQQKYQQSSKLMDTILSTARSNYFSIFKYSKSVSQFLTINPQMVLYDLYFGES